MNKVSIYTTTLVARFWLKIGNKTEVDINLHDLPTLHLAKGNEVFTEAGPGYLFTIAMLVKGEKGKYDFAMTFIVVDLAKKEPKIEDNFIVFPTAILDDDYHEECVTIEGNLAFRHSKPLQILHAKFASIWLQMLLTLGYLKN